MRKEISNNTIDKILTKGESLLIRFDLFLSSLSNNRKAKIGLWLFVVSLVFAVLFFLNVLTPLFADDLFYIFQFQKGGAITNLADLFDSQYDHYIHWGGRSVVHTILQAVLQLPTLVIDILNTLMYLVYTGLVYYFIKGRGAHSLWLYVLIHFALWFIMPAYGDTFLWITGSVNYLWGTTLILFFLLPYRFYKGVETNNMKQLVHAVLFFIYGVVAGWSNENTAGAMIVLAFLFLFIYQQQGWKIPVWAIVGIAGALVGYIIMLLAPGNAVRGSAAGETTLSLLLYRFSIYSYTLFVNYGVLLISYLVLLALYNKYKKVGSKRLHVVYSLGFLLAMFVGIYVMIFSPSFPPRAWFGALTFLIIALGILFYQLDFNQFFLRQIRMAILSISLVAFPLTFYWALRDVSVSHRVDIERALQAKQAIERGDEKCYFKQQVAITKFAHSEDAATNYILSRYYGIYILFE